MTGTTRRLDAERSMEELEGLADAAGARVVLRVLQDRPKPDPATFLGKRQGRDAGHARAMRWTSTSSSSTTSCRRRSCASWASASAARCIDRTQLILDIFARRCAHPRRQAPGRAGPARSTCCRAGRLIGAELSRLGGGIGTRGPGETKLETDRRRIRVRIHGSSEEIEHRAAAGSQLRDRRHKTPISPPSRWSATRMPARRRCSTVSRKRERRGLGRVVRHARPAGSSRDAARPPAVVASPTRSGSSIGCHTRSSRRSARRSRKRRALT
jgi:hypothetical protein